MAIIETTRPAPFGAVSTFRIVNLVDAAFVGFVGAFRARKTETALSKLSNAQLEDIGLVRAHIHGVAQRAGRI